MQPKNNDWSIVWLFLVCFLLYVVGSAFSPHIPNLVTVRRGVLSLDGWMPQIDHCKIQFSVWRGHWLNEIPPPGLPYVYVDPCCNGLCF